MSTAATSTVIVGRGASPAIIDALVRAGFTIRTALATPWTLRFPRDTDRDGARSIDECAFLLLCGHEDASGSSGSAGSWRTTLASFSRSTGGVNACVLLQLDRSSSSSDIAAVFLEDGTVRLAEASCEACSGLGRDFASRPCAEPAASDRVRCTCRRLIWLPVPRVGGDEIGDAAVAAADALVSAALHVRASLSGSKDRRQASAARLGSIASALASAPPPQLPQQLLTAACLAAVGALPPSGVVPSAADCAAAGVLPAASAAATALVDACGGIAQVVAALAPAFSYSAAGGPVSSAAAPLPALPIGQREAAALAAFFGTDRLTAAVAAAAAEEHDEADAVG